MSRPLVVVAEALAPAATQALLDPGDLEVRTVGPEPAALRAALAGAAALVVRSGTRVDAETLAAAPGLRVVACAGTDLGAVDVDAATRAGVLVVDTPEADAVSAAELTMALLLAAARHLVPVQGLDGAAPVPAPVGRELSGRTLGVVGLGQVGTLVAQRAAAFGMQVLATADDTPAGHAARTGVRAVPLPDLLAEADVLSLHVPAPTDGTPMIGSAELAGVRPGLVVVNAADDALLDEEALLVAIEDGRLAAVGLDLSDPGRQDPVRQRLLARPEVVATARAGGATLEAEERSGLHVVRAVRAVLAGELVADAVNVRGGPVAEEVRPGVPLTVALGRILGGLCAGTVAQVDVEVRGEITAHDVTVLESAALAGVLGEGANLVSAAAHAADRGVSSRLLTTDESPDHRNLVTVRGLLPDGTRHSVSGTLVGIARRHRLVEVDGLQVDLEPADHLTLLRYPDRPGAVGTLGGILGEAGVNIAGMQVSRDEPGGQALVALSVDSAVPDDLLGQVVAAIGAVQGCAVELGLKPPVSGCGG